MDYKQSDVVGTTWHRFGRVSIENPYQKQPVVNCAEQEVITLPSGDFIRDTDMLSFNFDALEEFPLLDPTTNTPLGVTSSGLNAYVLVYSYVMHEAAKRDLARGEPPVGMP